MFTATVFAYVTIPHGVTALLHTENSKNKKW